MKLWTIFMPRGRGGKLRVEIEIFRAVSVVKRHEFVRRIFGNLVASRSMIQTSNVRLSRDTRSKEEKKVELFECKHI